MILDCIVAVLIIATMVQGYRHGLLKTFIHTAGWLISLAAGFILSPKLNELLLDNTGLYDTIFLRINEKTDMILTPNQGSSDMPFVLENAYSNFMSSLSGTASEGLTLFLIKIISYFVVIFLIHLILRLIMAVFSHEHNKGFTGFADGLLGMLFGFLKGILYVYVLLAVMFPITAVFNADIMNLMASSLSHSHLAGDLYHNNLILLIVRDIL